MKLTREILKRMILENFPTQYKQSSFSTPTVPVPSMVRRQNPDYDPDNPWEQVYPETYIDFIFKSYQPIAEQN